MLNFIAERKRVFLGILFFAVFGFFSCYFFIDELIEIKARNFAQENGADLIHFDLESNNEGFCFADFELKIREGFDHVILRIGKVLDKSVNWNLLEFDNRRELVVQDLDLKGPKSTGYLKIKELKFKYDVAELFNKKLNSLSLSDSQLNLNGENIRSFLEEKKEEVSDEDKGNFFHEFFENPNLSFLKARDSWLRVFWENKEYDLSYDAKGQFAEDFTYLELDGELIGVPMKSDFTFNKEGKKIFLTSEIVLPNLADAEKLLAKLGPVGINFPSDLLIKKGFVKARSTAILENDFSFGAPFVEINGTDIQLKISQNDLEIDKFITFLSGDSRNPVKEVTSYANFSFNDHLKGFGANLFTRFQQGKTGLGGKIWKLIGTEPAAKFEVLGLTFPYFEVDQFEKISQLFAQPRTITFSSLSWNNSKIDITDGSINCSANEDFNEFAIKFLGKQTSLPEMQLSLLNVSYEGLFDLWKFPISPSLQTLKISDVFIGDDYQIKDFDFRFFSEFKNHFLIDEISFSPPNSLFQLEPANLSVTVNENSSPEIQSLVEFQGSNLVFKYNSYDMVVEGISGLIKVKNLDPFSTAVDQTITFKKFKFEELEFVDGNLTFTIEDGPLIRIKNLSCRGLGGTLGLRESTLSPNKGESLLQAFINQIEGQRIVELFDDLDLEIEGNFTGYIPLAPSKMSEQWDYMGGSLKMENTKPSRFRWDAKGRLTEGMNKNDADYQKNLLAEKALGNLLVKSMKFDFMVFEKGREVRGMIDGVSDIKGKKINLDYNPVIKGDLADLINLAEIFKIKSKDEN